MDCNQDALQASVVDPETKEALDVHEDAFRGGPKSRGGLVDQPCGGAENQGEAFRLLVHSSDSGSSHEERAAAEADPEPLPLLQQLRRLVQLHWVQRQRSALPVYPRCTAHLRGTLDAALPDELDVIVAGILGAFDHDHKGHLDHQDIRGVVEMHPAVHGDLGPGIRLDIHGRTLPDFPLKDDEDDSYLDGSL